jgi:hypothetical protein
MVRIDFAREPPRVKYKEMFNSHLLIPQKNGYTPTSNQIMSFLQELLRLGAAPKQPSISIRTLSGEISYSTNPNTGEKIPFPRWTPKQTIDQAATAPAIDKVNDYILFLDGDGPPALPPFDLYERGGSRFDPSKSYSFSVKLIARFEPIQLSEPWHEHLRTFWTPPGFTADICPRCGASHSPDGEIQPRFWIEFDFNEALLLDFTSDSLPIHPQILACAEQIFAVEFLHGRFFD